MPLSIDHMFPTNPYSYGMGVPAEEMFVGRVNELRHALSLLYRPHPQSVEILGPSRIGKTSLLERIFCMIGDGPDDSCPRCVMMSGLQTYRDQASLCRPLIEALSPVRGAIAHWKATPEGVTQLIDELSEERPLLLFIDDFDDAQFGEPALRYEYYAMLRALTWRRPFAICVTVRTPLAALCAKAEETGESLLWNIFSSLPIGVLDAASARELIYRPHDAAGLAVTQEEWEIVNDHAGRHPCLLQMAGHKLYEAKVQRGPVLDASARYDLKSGLDVDSPSYFRLSAKYLIARVPEAEPALTDLAHGSPVMKWAADALISLGLAYRDDDGIPRPYSSAFGKYLMSDYLETTHRQSSVFLCHASADREFAVRLCKDLQSRDVDVWIDWMNISPGDEFDQAIRDALYAATHVVLVMSKAAVKSTYVRSEIEVARAENKDVLPVVMEQVDRRQVPIIWCLPQRLNATTPAEYEAALERLVACLPKRSNRR